MGDYSNNENSEIDYNFMKSEDDGQLRDNLDFKYESFRHYGDNDGNNMGAHISNEGNDEFNAFKHGNNIDNNLINDMNTQDKNYNPEITFNIPGAFDNGQVEKMEIDDSPPFTIESDLYFDSQSQQNVDTNDLDYDRKEMFQSHFNRQQFLNVRGSNSSISGMGMINGAAPGNSGVGNGNNMNGIPGNISTPTPSSALQFDTPKSTQFTSFDNHHDNNSIYSSFLNDNEVGSFNDHMRTQSIDGGSSFNPTSLSVNPNNPNSLNIGIYQNYELSPLTTTTSLTPSVNSLHSNQPSFFSAQQYLSRHSVDNGNSFDQNSLSNSINNSINSGNQKRNVSGRYLNFNSISNYIPFMNDKRNGQDRTSPNGGPPSLLTHTSSLFNTSSTPRQQSKHLIRSIFKSNPSEGQSQELPETEGLNINLGPDMEEDFQSSDFLMMSPQETDDNLDPLPVKKSKKTKRGFLNRFKGPKQDENSEIEQVDNSSKNSGNNSFHEDEIDHVFHGNMSRTPSSANTVRTNNNVNTSNGNISMNNTSNGNVSLDNITPNLQEGKGPDYAALFENVGKRKPKKVSKPSNTLSFKKKIKAEDEYNDIHSNNSYGSESLSVSTSNTSHSYNVKVEDDNEEFNDDDESLTSASKRILGSKLMKRKGIKKEAEIKHVKSKIAGDKGVEVEVDLKTLDLPESTQIYPANIVTSKSRIRGRKENKEADLTDSSKIYLCNYCSRRFKRQEHLKRHFRSLHTFEKPYDCDICHKKFSRSDNLNQHLKIHKQEEEMNSLN
ncbi:putative transcriptional regulator Mnl1p [[Candida] jaroonii]|uniref:Transcriptional regulator Mnl1p n=1 Tax=[Candida] jaroonii TaxID=467808 RepID=A0ACA9Y423_9ASCO|nr:putative transcriptional regulator Mnl1p [[Candida] jaroonii]